jgi:hypothetical protein
MHLALVRSSPSSASPPLPTHPSEVVKKLSERFFVGKIENGCSEPLSAGRTFERRPLFF